MTKKKEQPKIKRASRGTVSVPEIIKDTVHRIKAIDNNESFDRSEKTRRIRALAESVKNKLHEDGRKKEENKVSLATYRRYLTDVRRAISAQNWHHHGLEKKLDVLARRYPQYAPSILAIKCKDVADTRNAHKELLEEIIDDSKAYEDVSALILNHEILHHLAMDSAKKAKMASAQQEALAHKKTNTIDVDYNWLMTTVNTLLTPNTSKDISFSRLALGIAFATGRRAIEVVYQGKFKLAGEYELDFSGTAKKRGGADHSKSYRIYTIVPAKTVMAAIELLRSQPEITALSFLDNLPENERNVAVNHRMAKTLNTTAKRIWMDDNRVFKDSRPVWARIVFENHFSSDKRWAKVDEDVFWHEQLCHEDIETQKAYKQFKIVHSEPVEKGDDRLSAVKDLLNNPDVVARGVLLKVTNWAISELKKDPAFSVNQNKIIVGTGCSRPAIKDWLAIAADALAKSPVLAIKKVEPKPTNEKAVESKPKKAVKPTAKKKSAEPVIKPRLKAVEISPEIWDVEIKIGDNTYDYTYANCPDKMEAMKLAWAEHTESN